MISSHLYENFAKCIIDLTGSGNIDNCTGADPVQWSRMVSHLRFMHSALSDNAAYDLGNFHNDSI